MDGALERDWHAFTQALPELLDPHRGEFALWKDGCAAGFFPSYGEAYAAGLQSFGLDDDFVIAEVDEQEPHSLSIAWQAGVAFDPGE